MKHLISKSLFLLIAVTGAAKAQTMTTPVLPLKQQIQYRTCSCESEYASDAYYQGCSRCYDGCFKARSGHYTFICRPCLDSCDSCTNPYQCNHCESAHFLTPDRDRCGACLVPNCETCIYPGTTCITCRESYYSRSPSTCAPCMTHCAVCRSGNTCESCNFWYDWSDYRRACVPMALWKKALYIILFIFIGLMVGIIACCVLCTEMMGKIFGSRRSRRYFDDGYRSGGYYRDGDYAVGDEDRIGRDGYGSRSRNKDNGQGRDYYVGDENKIGANGY